MLKKTITFQDLDGNDITEDFYFNLSEAELAEMELSADGGLSALLTRISATNDGAQVIGMFKDILGRSVGRRSEDNRRFIKNADIRDDFLQSDAYTKLFMELVTQQASSIEFVNGIVPASLREKVAAGEVAAMTELPSTATTAQDEDKRPAWLKEGRVPSSEELKGASSDELQQAFAMKMAQPSN